MEIFQQLATVLESMNSSFTDISKGRAGDKALLAQVVRAAIVKAYQFNCAVTKADAENVFFMMAFLRGVCEDYLVLKFLSGELKNDQDRAIELKLNEDLYKSAVSQWQFFRTNHPDQVLYYADDFPTKEAEQRDELRQLITKHGARLAGSKASLPTVRDMAAKSGLTELYDYIYHATSSLVHFSPRVLLRMGWGDLPEISFSVTHFGKYYKHFACFYGVYLLVQMCRWAMSVGFLDGTLETQLQKIDNLLKNESRWPELVTFEEMNIGALSRHLLFRSPATAEEGQKKNLP